MTIRLTETAINKAIREVAAARTRRDLSDETESGLRLRVSTTGSGTWVLACRDREGRMRRFQLGTWPEMGIRDAREEARAMRVRVKREGADPIAEARRERAAGEAARAGDGTFASVLDLYSDKVGLVQKAWPESRKRVNKVFGSLLKRPAIALTLSDLQLAADSYAFPKSAAFAVRTLRPVLKWASVPGRKYVAAELVLLTASARLERRKRILTREELKRLIPVLRSTARPYGAAMLFMLLTLGRRQEVAFARWGDIDTEAGTWTIPETKNGEPHVVPLSSRARELLEARLPRDDGGKPVQPPVGTFLFTTSTGSPLGNWDRETKAIQNASQTANWTRHDLRRTGATMLGEMGELPDIVEAALNHVSIRSALAATYNRSRYRPQVAAALQRLADSLHALIPADGWTETDEGFLAPGGDGRAVPLAGARSGPRKRTVSSVRAASPLRQPSKNTRRLPANSKQRGNTGTSEVDPGNWTDS